jgi:hypothetical protein
MQLKKAKNSSTRNPPKDDPEPSAGDPAKSIPCLRQSEHTQFVGHRISAACRGAELREIGSLLAWFSEQLPGIFTHKVRV